MLYLLRNIHSSLSPLFEPAPKEAVFHCGHFFVWYKSMSYTAANIKILNKEEQDERFIWNKAKTLSRVYPHITYDHILRLLEACLLSGYDIELAIRKYLAKEDNIKVTPELIEVFKELADQRRQSSK